jgi:hypothetical protein
LDDLATFEKVRYWIKTVRRHEEVSIQIMWSRKNLRIIMFYLINGFLKSLWLHWVRWCFLWVSDFFNATFCRLSCRVGSGQSAKCRSIEGKQQPGSLYSSTGKQERIEEVTNPQKTSTNLFKVDCHNIIQMLVVTTFSWIRVGGSLFLMQVDTYW